MLVCVERCTRKDWRGLGYEASGCLSMVLRQMRCGPGAVCWPGACGMSGDEGRGRGDASWTQDRLGRALERNEGLAAYVKANTKQGGSGQRCGADQLGYEERSAVMAVVVVVDRGRQLNLGVYEL